MKNFSLKKNFKPGMEKIIKTATVALLIPSKALVGLRKHLANLDCLLPQILPGLAKHFV